MQNQATKSPDGETEDLEGGPEFGKVVRLTSVEDAFLGYLR